MMINSVYLQLLGETKSMTLAGNILKLEKDKKLYARTYNGLLIEEDRLGPWF
jgi:hypothetical protein